MTPEELAQLTRSRYSREWGDLSAGEQTALTEDIKRRGVLHPPKVRAGEVIDGWHRVLAAIAAGRSIDVVELDAATTHEELASLTAAENCLRRNMPKLDAALALTRLRGMADDGTCSTTVEADASMLGTSERTIQYARAQLRQEMGLSTPGSAPPRPRNPGGMTIPHLRRDCLGVQTCTPRTLDSNPSPRASARRTSTPG